MSAHLARGGAPGCVTLSRCSRDARGEGPSTPPPWVCGECGCVRVAPRRSLWCPRCVCVGRGAGGVAAFVGPSGCVPFVLRAPSDSLGSRGRLCEGGSSPFVGASPCRPRTPVWRVTPLTGEGSLGSGVRARAFVSTPGFFVSLPFLATAWAPLARVVAPLCVTVPLRGARVPRSRGRAFCSRAPILVHRPPRCAPSRVPARVPRLCPVECVISLVCVFIRECS